MHENDSANTENHFIHIQRPSTFYLPGNALNTISSFSMEWRGKEKFLIICCWFQSLWRYSVILSMYCLLCFASKGFSLIKCFCMIPIVQSLSKYFKSNSYQRFSILLRPFFFFLNKEFQVTYPNWFKTVEQWKKGQCKHAQYGICSQIEILCFLMLCRKLNFLGSCKTDWILHFSICFAIKRATMRRP